MINHDEWVNLSGILWVITLGGPISITLFNEWVAWMKERDPKNNFIIKFAHSLFTKEEYGGDSAFIAGGVWLIVFMVIPMPASSLILRAVNDPIKYGTIASVIFLFIAITKAGRHGFRVKNMLDSHVKDKNAHDKGE